MALSKVAESKTTEVIQLITPQESEEIQMGIDMSAIAHLLDRLTDLYPDPISATVREVISNAYDATILVPSQDRKAIRVSNPTQENPSFIVEDFGVGMSLHDVKNIYSMYGASTKMLDMRQIGAYGLGAKSPLAYCTEFLVETTKHGRTTVFSIARKAEGNFTKIIREGETDLPSGTRVTIPVKHHDAEDFKAAVELYRKFTFDTNFEIDGVSVAQPDYTEITSDFVLERETGLSGRVWIRNDAFHKSILTRVGALRSSQDYVFSLSGWPYKNSTAYRIDNPDFVFELKPGVVDFSSSRDDITKNDRGRALESLVTKYLSCKEKGLDDVFEAYRSLDDGKAKQVFAKTLRSSRRIEDSKLVFKESSHYSYSTEEYLDTSRFITDSGYDPASVMLKNDKPILQSAISIPENVRGAEVTHIGSESLPWYGDTMFYSSKIGVMNERLLARASVNTNLYSLTGILSRLYVDQIATGKGYRALIITDANTANTRKILAGRKSLSELEDYQNNIALFTQLETKKLKPQINFAEANLDATITIKSAATVIEDIRKARAEIRKEKVGTPNEESFRLRLLTNGADEEAKILNTYSYETAIVTPQKIMDENALVILHGTVSNDSALIGAANAGIEITNRPIYVTDQSYLLKAPHYKALENYDGIIAARGFRGRSKLASNIGSKRTFYGKVLNSRLQELTPELTAKLFIDNTPVGEGFIHDFSDFLNKNHRDNTRLRKAFKLISEGYKSKERIHIEITEEQLEVKLKSQKKLFTVLYDFLKTFNGYGGTVTSNVYSQYVRSYSRLQASDAELMTLVYELLHRDLTEKLNAAGVKV